MDGRSVWLYRVFGPLVDAGYEYEIGSRWYPATDPRVIARRQEESRTKDDFEAIFK